MTAMTRGAAVMRVAAYGGWFFASFLVGVYLTFPLDDVRGVVAGRLEDALGKGSQGPHGVDPRVQIGGLSLSGFGVKAERVQLQLPSRNPDPGPSFELDELAIGVRPWTLLSKVKTITVAAELYEGEVDAVVSVDDKGQLHAARVEIEDIDLGRVPAIQAQLGVPVGGRLEVDADLDLGASPEKDGSGGIQLRLKGLSIGPGNLKHAAAFGGFELPAIDIGTLSGELPVKQGKGTLTDVKVNGADVQAELLGEVFLKQDLGNTRLDVDGWFMPTPSFLEREKKFQSLLQLGESLGGNMSLSRAKDDRGHYWFSAKGVASSPALALARDGGRKAMGKAGKPAASPPEPRESRRSKPDLSRPAPAAAPDPASEPDTVGERAADDTAPGAQPGTE